MADSNKVVYLDKFKQKNPKDARLASLKESFNLVGEEDVLELAIRVLERAAEENSGIFYFIDDELFEIEIG